MVAKQLGESMYQENSRRMTFALPPGSKTLGPDASDSSPLPPKPAPPWALGPGQRAGCLARFLIPFPFALARVPSPSLKAAPSHTDLGSGGRRSWHRRGTARCPANSGRWAAAPAHSPSRLPRNDFYIHTCACPVGRAEKMRSPFSRTPGPLCALRAPIQYGRCSEAPGKCLACK